MAPELAAQISTRTVPHPWNEAFTAARWWLLPMATCAFLMLPFLNRLGSLEGHEVLVAQTAREMVRTGDWLHPTFAGEPRYQKPPLAYWVTVLSYLATKQWSPAAARLPSLLAAIASTLLVALVAKKHYGSKIAERAGFIHATSLWVIGYGTSPVVDCFLALLIASAIFLANVTSTPRMSRVLAFWVLVALAALAKGPVGPLLILLVIAGNEIIPRFSSFPATAPNMGVFFRTPAHFLGLVIALIIAGIWPALLIASKPELIELWIDQSVGRYVAHWGPQTRPWYYYLYQVPFLTLPWTPLWIIAVISFRKSPPFTRFLILWPAIMILFLSLSEGKREHYGLPALLPLSILAALGWETAASIASFRKRISFAMVGSLVVVGILSIQIVRGFIVDDNESLQQLIDRQRVALAAAPRILQFGSNDHATAFLIDRPMRWVGSSVDLERELQLEPKALILTPSQDWDTLQPQPRVRILDQSESADDWLLLRIAKE